jgi:hypothetical protein
MTYLLYSANIERAEPDEQQTIDGIIEGMTKQSETVEKRERHAVRASHAKSSGCVVGTLKITDGLPSELSQGLFAKAGEFPVAVRFAQGPGETLGDRVSTHRGMAIKIFDVEGAKLASHQSDTQDFVFATGSTFPSGTASGFLKDAKQIGAATPAPEGFKSAVSSLARNFNRVLHTMGTESPKADFFGHPFTHPLSDVYFSQAPVRYGDYVAKLAAFPSPETVSRIAGIQIDPKEDEDGFRHAVVSFFRDEEARFDLRVQLWANSEKQPIEDASVDWPIAISPYQTVGTISLPAQDAYSDARVFYFDEVMTFRPAHSLAAHQPLGSVMRARLQVYAALSKFRHAENGVTANEPESIKKIPA